MTMRVAAAFARQSVDWVAKSCQLRYRSLLLSTLPMAFAHRADEAIDVLPVVR